MKDNGIGVQGQVLFGDGACAPNGENKKGDENNF